MSKTVKTNRTNVLNVISETKGKFFTVTFTKNNGTERTINGNVNMTKQGKLGYVRVYSMKDKSYRNVDTRTIKSVSFNGTIYNVR